MQPVDIPLKWGPEKRLEFIEYRLFWENSINRSALTERFGVSIPQASNDLTLYKELAPTNLEYDVSAKRYVASSDFKFRFLKPNPDRYLAQLKGIADGIIGIENTEMSYSPDAGVLPIPSRRIDPYILRALLMAVRDKQALHIQYQSMNPDQPDPLWRWITPHAFGFDGLRWHARAFCHRRKSFNDFIIGRCMATAENGVPEASPEIDWCWQNTFEVILKPNPELPKGHRHAIALDYGMQDERIKVPVRYALLYYFNKRLRLDVGEHLDKPHERPIIVENRLDFEEAIAKANTR